MIEKWRSNVIIFFLMAYPILFFSQFGRGLGWKTPIIPIFFPLYFHSNQTMKNYIFLFIVLPFFSFPPHLKLDPWRNGMIRPWLHKVTEWVGLSWSIGLHESACQPFSPLFCQQPFSFYLVLVTFNLFIQQS